MKTARATARRLGHDASSIAEAEARWATKGSASISELGDWDNCPLKHYLARVVRHQPEVPSHYLVLGIAVHDALHKIADDHVHGRDVDADRIDHLWEEAAADAGLLEHYPDLLGEGRALTQAGADLLADITPDNILALEDWLPRGFAVGQVPIVGRLDLAYLADDGAVVVLDWKTSKRPPALRPGSRSGAGPGINPQLGVYACAAQQLQADGIWPDGPIRAVFGMLRQERVIGLDLQDEDPARLRAWIEPLYGAMRSCRDPQPTPNRLCDWCDFQVACPAFVPLEPDLDVRHVVEQLELAGVPWPRIAAEALTVNEEGLAAILATEPSVRDAIYNGARR